MGNQTRALRHTELVLFIDHHKTEIRKCACIVKQCVCANDDLLSTSLGMMRILLTVAGSQGNPHAKRSEPFLKRKIMLLRKNLRGGHQCRLTTGVDREQH